MFMPDVAEVERFLGRFSEFSANLIDELHRFKVRGFPGDNGRQNEPIRTSVLKVEPFIARFVNVDLETWFTQFLSPAFQHSPSCYPVFTE